MRISSFFQNIPEWVILLWLSLIPCGSTLAQPGSDNGNINHTSIASSELIEKYVQAVNSPDRNDMSGFVSRYYDRNFLKQVPFDILVSFNRSYYYESGGMGYDLVSIPVTVSGALKAELVNRFTGSRISMTVPSSGPPSNAITGIVQMQVLEENSKEKKQAELSDDEFAGKIKAFLNKMVEDEEFSGAVLVAQNDKILFRQAFGYASMAYEFPNRADTRFNLASIGKMFTGLAIVQLVEKGMLSFDDTLSKFVPQSWLKPEISSRIQIKHLLTHTSGLGDYFRDAYGQCNVNVFRELDDYRVLTSDDTLLSEPGSAFSYSNTGMLLLGVVIENVTHEKYFTYLRKNIFEPAGMLKSGGFDKDRPVSNLATGYSKSYENGEPVWSNNQVTRIVRGSPSGRVYSTVDDLYSFSEALKNSRLLSETYTRILIAGRPELHASFHSYGMFVSKGAAGTVASHQGDGTGVNGQFKMYLDSGYTVIVLSNYNQPSANTAANTIHQLILAREGF
ncbi:MAG: serine hydrolase [Bacteroidales bacterium]|nr:serine hydrolase [Bacteroidales bacterium]